MEIKIDPKTLTSPLGIIIAIAVVAAAFGYAHWRRAALVEQGSEQVVSYLRLELPAKAMRESGSTPPDPERLEHLGEVEVVEFSPSLFFRADRDDTVKVRTVVRIGTGETATFHFRFKRVLGEWRLEREAHTTFLDVFE